jgi:hypothetical protein
MENSNKISSVIFGLWALSVTGNVIVCLPELFSTYRHYPGGIHGGAQDSYKYDIADRYLGLTLGLMGVPLFLIFK